MKLDLIYIPFRVLMPQLLDALDLEICSDSPAGPAGPTLKKERSSPERPAGRDSPLASSHASRDTALASSHGSRDTALASLKCIPNQTLVQVIQTITDPAKQIGPPGLQNR